MVGEMRDVETMQTVLTAAETGHLVFSTLHTNNAAQTLDRIIDAFPPEQHKQIRSQLSLVLRGIISLKLIKTNAGKMTAAVEILKNSPRIAKLIEEGHTKDILEEIESSVGLYRMQSMNQSLIALLVHQKITYQDAMELSSDPDDLSLKLRKLFPQIEERVRQGGDMAPSYSDFSQITELMDIKRLYEEQEVQWRQRLARQGRRARGPAPRRRLPPRAGRAGRGRRQAEGRGDRPPPRRGRAPPRRRPGQDHPAPGADQGAESEADGGERRRRRRR